MKRFGWLISALYITFLLAACGTGMVPPQVSGVESDAPQSSERVSEAVPEETNGFDEYKKYADAFVFDLGRDSWDSAEEIAPDALVNFYIYLSGIGEVTIPEDGPRDEIFGNPYMLADDLEQAVMKHFDVTPEQIRKSEYYDKARNAYWTGGIGSTVDTEIVGVKQEGKRLTLTLSNRIASTEYNAHWQSTVVLEVDGDDYRYISFTREAAVVE